MPLCNTHRVRAMPLAFSLIVVSIFLSAFGHASGRPPALPLANVYHPGVNLEEYWVSEKLDGVRVFWDGETLWSRGGYRYSAPAWFTRHFPAQPLDGELWSGRGRFAELSGVVRKAQPVDRKWRGVRFHAFDWPEREGALEQRYRRLQRLVPGADSRHVVRAEPRVGAGHAEVVARVQQPVAGGGEELLLIRRESLY